MNENTNSIRTAVIVAQGFLSAPDSRGPTVWREKIGGLTLLERAVLSSRKAGIQQWITLGIREEETEKIRKRLDSSQKIFSLSAQGNVCWDKETWRGVGQALKGEREFFLISADCVFEPSAIKKLRQGSALLKSFPAVAAIQKDLSPNSPMGTKNNDSQITRLGNGEKARGTCPGLLMCDASFLEIVWDKLSIRPLASIGEMLRELERAGRLGGQDVRDALLRHAGTEMNRRDTERALFRALVKKTDGFLATHINRKISLFITRFLVKTSLTPNQATLINLTIGLCGGLFFALGGYGPVLMGALLFQFSSITDGCDGEIARLKFMESRMGGWLDILCDNLTHMAVFGGIAYGACRTDPAAHWIVLGWLAVFGTLMSFLLVALQLYWKESGAGPFFTTVMEDKAGKSVEGITNLQDGLARRDFTYLLLLFSLFGYAKYFLALTAIGSNIFWMLLVYSRMKLQNAGN